MLSIYSILYAQIIVYLILFNILKLINIDNEILNLFKKIYCNNNNLIINFFISYILLKLNDKYNFNLPKLYGRILMIIIFNLVLSIYIKNTSLNNQYLLLFKNWTNMVSWFSIFWNIIYYLSISSLADKINNIEIIKKYSITIMLCFVIILLHI
jgi:hypothetical protein